MHKKLKKWVIAAAALVTVAAVGVTLAFMFKKANVKNTFVPAEVSCTAYEKLDGEDITEATAKGGEKSVSVVENTGKVNEYLRVRLYPISQMRKVMSRVPNRRYIRISP